ncbi:PLD nuclease N-terminal domain-containing protein [Mucilaginibacter segetis]|uniref:PLDc_N domain-containing protein n=1 Tax=Mucilaginibacter segetis TaxID=2793071 RepID=A0A934UMN7_9SPHI|nr:PLD nuclease N-terminal domain-containing protein [Mucilaginibacter segetis]MBK0379584.1 PLDc_N domain-containing protein [Mucilaginibacter segetis]
MSVLSFLNIGGPELILAILALIAYPIMVIFCLIDIIRSDFKDQNTKLLWIVIVLLAPFLGSILYLTIGRNSKSGGL